MPLSVMQMDAFYAQAERLKKLAKSPPKPATFHDWPGLPTEIKMNVLSYYLAIGTNVTIQVHKEMLRDEVGKLGKLLHTRNRELAVLASIIYYQSNTFMMQISCDSSRLLLQCPSLAYGHLVRRLDIVLGPCDVGKTLHDTLHGGWPENAARLAQSPWRFLFTPIHPIAQADGREELINEEQGYVWQASFPNLKYVKIRTTVLALTKFPSPRACRRCFQSPRILKLLKAQLGKTQMSIKAKKVVVVVRSVIDNSYGSVMTCPCLLPLEKKICRLAKKA